MKRFTVLMMIALLVGGTAFAQTSLSGFSPKDAKTMSMGGAFIAMSEGYQSLYGNPAAFADKKAEFTLLSISPWVYLSPTTDNIDSFSQIVSGEGSDAAMISMLSDLVTGNGFGAGASAGLGWVGKGLGLGIVGGADAYLDGKTLLGAKGKLDGQIAAVVGIGVPLNLGPFRLQVGGDVRPYLRMTGDIVGTQMIKAMAGGGEFDPMTLPVDVGFGLAVDLGASLDLGNLVSVGLAVRDISTKQTYTQSTVEGVIDSLGAGSLPDGDDVKYSVMPNITLGASLTPIPVGLRKLINVTILAEIQDPIKVIANNTSLWNLFHVGAEAKLLGGFLALRGGVNQGWLSFGAGLDLLILELNVAVFTEELGSYPGDRGRTGVSAEVAIRF